MTYVHDKIVHGLTTIKPQIFIEPDSVSPETYYPDETDLVRKIKQSSRDTHWEWGIVTLELSYADFIVELSEHVSFSSREDFMESPVYKNLLNEALSELAYKIEYAYYPFLHPPGSSPQTFYNLLTKLAATYTEFHMSRNSCVILLHATYADITTTKTHPSNAFIPPSKFFSSQSYLNLKSEALTHIASVLYGMLEPFL